MAVHGFRGNHKALTDFADCFEHQRVILVDLPGHGLSETMQCKHTLRNFAVYLHSFIHALLGEEHFTLWGHSYGGSICIEYASLYPEQLKSLVLVSPAVSVDGLLAKAAAVYYKASYLLPKQLRKAWLANSIIDQISAELLIKNVSKQRKLEMKAAGKSNLKELNPTVVVESSLSYFETDLLRAARKIQTRTLVIAGALDQVVPLARIELLVKTMVNAELAVIPDHGHLAPLEMPGKVASLTQEFMQTKV